MDQRDYRGEVITERTLHGVRFVFPRRQGPWRVRDFIGTLAMLFIFGVFVGVFWAAVLQGKGQERAVEILLASVVTLFVLVVLGLMVWVTVHPTPGSKLSRTSETGIFQRKQGKAGAVPWFYSRLSRSIRHDSETG